MDFRLTFPIAPLQPALEYRDPLLLMGSCFAEEMGGKLQEHLFPALVNPHGILYNPLSIAKAVHSYLDQKQYTEADLFMHNDGWHSWDHHSRFSALTPAAALEKINTLQQQAARRLQEARWLVITLGSAHAYVLKETGQLVANCHKVPMAAFQKKLLGADEIIAALDSMMHRLFFSNREVHILFTVSPVRYARDGVVENNLSKAVLLQAVHHLVHKFDRLHYFPAYELVIDDLRDYRFYKDDLVHPNETAVNYVWEHFVQHCVHPGSRQLLQAIAGINRAARHRPFNPDSPQHRQFLQTYARKVEQLQQEHPYLQWEEMRKHFNY
ncbi:GSCFA domain-containing protein [Chitinophaga japonensis]|uniref:GSCFA family protein n=1 Tax=Chitinophaga japonensis TaxID=104662 RepID=A0A562SSB8_CHIJA|nr:GSCFA domain-containing protein [Chitinophaga japonensis]TWI84157.1 GSCFA family protein [Chitinophaga japonensis]